MALLRIGHLTINTDHVREIYTAPSGDSVVVRFGLDRQVGFAGDEAQALVRWLNEHATNLTPQNPDDEEWEEYKAAGGDMSRPRWERTKRELEQLNRDLEHGYTKQGMQRASELEVRLGY